ncbi:DegT/DnrJ/EryC1/StrS family aminotransferase [Limnospira fusiformis CCALA 023]|uniref:Aminotransferase n=1 Tax=Limnospira platensis NIES-46 TaxID=1236695 RepID=A0A5M3T3P1_LIMPL|nr:DegT/DnrJ/EryC1/StrS family aminotransferase [Arthrospira platensis]MDF2212516.1 DegT/DnrJ/EryC1/StrS family aminotransferase [Arthrospira platensis NCB002]MDT9294050.1 DegT/DnrJ/EryC1/StrS family aminotransferase [Arthrospira platensis PCC 7345]BAI91918.1 aminotransferase [Arthrospira platensis NIES-39]BDT14252.1 aminotransferase [Arthrospira platensis NIES-39]GCE92119.1 aminotransferase [Arthrospira platensis NIES-46]
MTNSIAPIPFVDLSFQYQELTDEIEKAIHAVIGRGDFILGRALQEFEADFATACGAKYGVGVACGTDAIAIGLQACGVKPGDEVLVPANTFIATIIGILQARAKPVLVDCELSTALIDIAAAERAVTAKTKAILPVHLYGQIVTPSQLLDLALSHNLIVFEDAAQAHLATCENYRAGSIGRAAAFSFYPSKNLGAFGSGGMVVTSDETVAKQARILRNYGAPEKYVHTEQGTNSRLDTIQAAVLNVKLRHLPGWNRDRNLAAEQYDVQLMVLKEHGIIPIYNYSEGGHVYHLYVIRVTEECSLTRDQLQAKLNELGVQTGIHYPIPCHLQPGYTDLGYKAGDFPKTETLSQQILSLPMYPGITSDQINQVVAAIRTALGLKKD